MKLEKEERVLEYFTLIGFVITIRSRMRKYLFSLSQTNIYGLMVVHLMKPFSNDNLLSTTSDDSLK